MEKLLDFRSLTGGAKDSSSEQPSLDTAADTAAFDGHVAELSLSQPAEPADVETKANDVETKTETENVEAGEKVAVAEEGARDSTPSCGPPEGSPSTPVKGNDEGISLLEAAETS